jgi:hypothetical protein
LPHERLALGWRKEHNLAPSLPARYETLPLWSNAILSAFCPMGRLQNTTQ